MRMCLYQPLSGLRHELCMFAISASLPNSLGKWFVTSDEKKLYYRSNQFTTGGARAGAAKAIENKPCNNGITIDGRLPPSVKVYYTLYL